MTDIKRYDFDIGDCPEDGLFYYECANEHGRYVRYADHVASIARVEEARDKAIVVAVGRMSAETYYVLCQEIEDLKKDNAALLAKIGEMQQ